jgi:hypothetical protein
MSTCRSLVALGRGRRAFRKNADGEQGFVLVYFAMLLLVLMAMAGFGVDIGSWYLRSSQIQRAADAAALAGVVWMPGNFAQAQTVAVDTAKRNGFDDTDPNISVTVEPDPASDRRLRVTIADLSIKRYFSQVFISNVTQTRAATAEYVLPIPMGSPENSFGTGNVDLGGGVTSKIWASVNGYCTAQEDGDKLLSRYDGIRPSGGYSCPHPSLTPSSPAKLSADYDPSGYYYDVEVPSGYSSNVNFDVYDAGFNPLGCGASGGGGGGWGGGGGGGGSSLTSPDLPLATGGAFTTIFKVWYSPAPLDHTQDVLKTTLTFAANDSANCGKWSTLWTWPSSAPSGMYRIQVFTQAAESATAIGSNNFGLRAGNAAGWARCSTLTTTMCPQVHGEAAISVYANQSGATATFYLAQVAAVYAGRQMDIELFDPGEGASTIEILDPSGTPQSFAYATTDPRTGWNDYSGTTTILDVTGSGGSHAGYSSSYKYSDRHVRLRVTVPSSYGSGTLANGGWWQIRYKTGTATVTDRTTWSVTIVGNPVHLVN